MKTKGVVTRIGDGKFSKYIMIDTKDGYYLNTKYNPKCGVGDTIGVEYEAKGDTRGNIKKVVILNDAGGPKGVQESSSSSSGGGAGGGKSGAVQESIIMQHSQEMAIGYVGLLLSAEAIKLPKASEKEGFLSNLVNESTARFVAQATDPKTTEPTEETTEEKAEEFDSKDDESGDEWGGDDEWSS